MVEWGMNATLQKAEVIHAQAAGFTFRIVLHPSANTYIQKEFRKQILAFLKGFTILAARPDISFHIHHRTDDFGNERLLKNNCAFFPFRCQEDQQTVHTFYDLSIFQFRAVFFEYITGLMEKSGRFLLLHAASVRSRRGAHIFLARSGGGKTTITRLLRKHCPVLTEETALLRADKDKFSLFQLPQIEKDAFPAKTPASYPVTGLYLLKKATKNKLTPLSGKAVSSLIDAGSFRKPNKKLMGQLLKTVPLYTLAFSKDPQQSRQLAGLIAGKINQPDGRTV